MPSRPARTPATPLLAVLVASVLMAATPEGSRADAPAAEPPRPACPLESSLRVESATPVWEDDPVPTPKKKAWEDALGGQLAARPIVRARMKGWPTAALVDRAALPHDDRAFLGRLARDTWRGLDAFTDRENGLPVDHVRIEDDGDGAPGGVVGDYTNVTNVGMHLIAVVAARALDLVPERDAIAAIERTLDTLDRLETHAGFFFNYYDTTSLERTSNFVSFVDSSWLIAGLMVARAAFPILAARTTPLIDRMDYRFFYDEKLGLLSHGYFVHRRARSRYHYGVLYTEARLGALLAVGKGEVPEATWFRMVRTYPADCLGQTQTPVAATRKVVRGHEVWGGWYEWQGERYVPSWGGSMFEALMPLLVVDEQRAAPTSLGPNDVAHAVVQRRYALETLGYPVWGLSPAAIPSDGYREFGVRPLGARGYGAGIVTPHASALALAVTPVEATANLRRLAERYDLYGDYGLYDAVDPASGNVARAYLALDQAMTLVAIANHLRGGVIPELFATDPIAKRALAILGDERFFE
ncbi:MAG: DUF3131 domain-containing protein [Deltaproteobacteria bacterium]|nr:DUF3131 domain-containing protein [Deltaproteobacteria bacterium]